MNAPIDVSDIRIETRRLVLRPWRESDLEDLNAYASVEGVGEMAGWKHHESLEESQKILEWFIAGKKTFAIEWKETGRVIGSLGLEELGEMDAAHEKRLGREVGYVLEKDYWGQGLMPEAVQAVIAYCFRVLGYDFLTCGHFLENGQSRRVIEKCGFHYWKEGTYRTRTGAGEADRLSRIYLLENPGR